MMFTKTKAATLVALLSIAPLTNCSKLASISVPAYSYYDEYKKYEKYFYIPHFINKLIVTSKLEIDENRGLRDIYILELSQQDSHNNIKENKIYTNEDRDLFTRIASQENISFDTTAYHTTSNREELLKNTSVKLMQQALSYSVYRTYEKEKGDAFSLFYQFNVHAQSSTRFRMELIINKLDIYIRNDQLI